MTIHKLFMEARVLGSQGIVMVVAVLIVSAIGAAIGAALLLMGLSESQTGFIHQQSYQSKDLADACIEDALQQIHDNVSFTGMRTLTFGQGTCSSTVVTAGGQARIVTASATVGSVIRKVKVALDKITPAIHITSWQEVADF